MAFLETDPLDVQLDEDGDILIDEDGLHLTSGIEAVAQLCSIAVKLFKGEWFKDLDKGVPWFQEILGEKFDKILVEARLTETLVSVPGVVEVLSLDASFDRATRRVVVSGAVRTEFGDVPLDALAIGGSDA